uniref:THAP domain-containing protein 1 n=1 Tax=Oreochromis aureus TaxID=47969 RepID=A0AAZ1XRJ7_OREAU
MPTHCCVPLCSASAKFNSILSFHDFPTHSDLRRQWLVNIRRDHFTITSHTRVCSRHFASDQLIEPTTLDGRRRLIKGAVPTLFEWNGYKVEPPRRSVWERTERRPELVPPDDQEEHTAEDLSKDVETLRKEIQELRVQREFGLQRFAGSDTDIRFYTSVSSLNENKIDIYFFSADCMFHVDALVFKQYPNATGKIQHQIDS